MWTVDEDLLAALDRTDSPHVVPLTVSADAPHLELEVLSGPHLEWPAADNDRREVIRACTRRFAKLREPYANGARGHLLIARGERTIGGSPPALSVADGRELWADVMQALAGEAARTDDSEPGVLCVDAYDPARAAVFGVSVEEARPAGEPSAYVAVVSLPAAGFPITESVPTAAEQLVARLVNGIARNAPLFVVGVLPDHWGGSGRADLLARCQRLRISLVLDGSDRCRADMLTLTRARIGGRAHDTDVTLVPSPPFRPGAGAPGVVRLRLDVCTGQALIAFTSDRGSDYGPVGGLQVTRRLLSASRVSTAERDLRSHVLEKLEPVDQKARQAFDLRSAELWQDSGYATVCSEDGLPAGVVATRRTRYFLLLLLREREPGRYDILLSHHTPVRRSELAEWETLLLPAFQDVRSLLEHLRDDVVRHVTEGVDDLERAAHARAFQQAVDRILQQAGGQSDLWADELREVADFTTRKISPTTGEITEYEYRLVTLLPLVDRQAAKDADPGTAAAEPGTAPKTSLDHVRIIEWLSRLIEVAEDPRDGAISIETLTTGGSGLRWDPDAELPAERGAAQRQRAQQLPPGAVWFPLTGADEAPWRRCPSIAARNADVMIWVEKELAAHRQADGTYPRELVLGQFAEAGEPYRILDPVIPYADDATTGTPGKPTSTLDALANVRFGPGDLEERRPYADATIDRAYLVRRALEGRDAIVVIKADAPLTAAVLEARAPFGVLRPVQRYVMAAGIARAGAINDLVLPRLEDENEPWGFLRILQRGGLRPITIAPPVIERVTQADAVGGDLIDFVLVDGNHRVIHRVWNAGQPMPVVAASGVPEPYYAHPQGRWDWEVTSTNLWDVAPPPHIKYLTRLAPEPKDDAARAALERFKPPERYRRWFRNLASGFGYIGGQAGKPA